MASLLRLFLFAFAGGALLTVLLAWQFPFPGILRLPAQTETLPNSGRHETFQIRLPGDRLGIPQAAPVAEFPRGAFSESGGPQVVAELFRVRDVDGDVIGLAARMSGPVASPEGERTQAVDWLLVLPGRGGLLMSRGGSPALKFRRARIDPMGFDTRRTGTVIAGTRNFRDLSGLYIEETLKEAARAEDDGVRGRLILRTRLRGQEP